MTDTDGSPEYAMTWKRRAMQSGAPICRLLARVRRTSGKGCSGWPTPTKGLGGGKGDGSNSHGLDLWEAAKLTGWPTPMMPNGGRNGLRTSEGREGEMRHLEAMPKVMAGWPTPMAGTPATEDYNEAGNTDSSRKTVELLTGWATPTAQPANGEPKAFIERKRRAVANGSAMGTGLTDLQMQSQAYLAGWATPQCYDAENAHSPRLKKDRQTRDPNMTGSYRADLKDQALGLLAESSAAKTAKPDAYRLNPFYSLWLMGYPVAWGFCGVLAMQSCRKRPRSS